MKVFSWKVNLSNEGQVKFTLFDNEHCLPKYTFVVDSSLEFIVLLHNWSLSKNHVIQKEIKCCVKYTNVLELLQAINTAPLCNGLPHGDDDVQSAAMDPTSKCSSGSVLHHSIPKLPSDNASHFEVTVIFHSVNRELTLSSQSVKEECKPCSTAHSE